MRERHDTVHSIRTGAHEEKVRFNPPAPPPPLRPVQRANIPRPRNPRRGSGFFFMAVRCARTTSRFRRISSLRREVDAFAKVNRLAIAGNRTERCGESRRIIAVAGNCARRCASKQRSRRSIRFVTFERHTAGFLRRQIVERVLPPLAPPRQH